MKQGSKPLVPGGSGFRSFDTCYCCQWALLCCLCLNFFQGCQFVSPCAKQGRTLEKYWLAVKKKKSKLENRSEPANWFGSLLNWVGFGSLN